MRSLGRVANLVDYTVASLWRKKVRNLAVCILFALIVFLLTSLQLINRSLTEMTVRVLQTVPDITVQQMSAGRQVSVPIEYSQRLSEIFGVRAVRERIWGYYFHESTGANFTVIGLDDLEEVAGSFFQDELAHGRWPSPDESGKVVLGSQVKELLQLGDRKFFSLFQPDLGQSSFEVAGFFGVDLDGVTADAIVMTLADARLLFAISPDVVTDLLIDVSNPQEIDTIARKINDLFPASRVITRSQIQKTYRVVFNWRSGLGMFCLLGAILAFGILAWDKASGLSSEDKHEVGVLKAVGWMTSDIIFLRWTVLKLIPG